MRVRQKVCIIIIIIVVIIVILCANAERWNAARGEQPCCRSLVAGMSCTATSGPGRVAAAAVEV